MKEITRIHIAKTPYDIELAAKKTLDTYMKTLEAYSEDAEIIEDVEVRITEILAERSIQKGGVIAMADIEALKEQLGDPSEFMGEGDIAVGPEAVTEGTRKLFRDTDHALVGGVLSGIAAFFKINPVWIRLLFVVLALASFGTMLLVYIVLWIAVPSARTATDKLQLVGRPVTVRAIREMNENSMGESAAAKADARQALFILLGIGCVIGAVLSAAVTVAALLGGLLFRRNAFESAGGDFLLGAFTLAVISGLLLTVLFILGAYASFVRKLTHRIIISICIVVVLGLTSFGTAAGLMQYGSMRDLQVVRDNTREDTVLLPRLTSSVTGAKIKGEGVLVRYIVSEDTPSAKIHAMAKSETNMPKVSIDLKKNILEVTVKRSSADCGMAWGCERPVLTIYGPALKNISGEEGVLAEYGAATQQTLVVTAGREADMTVSQGSIGTVTASADEDAHVSVADATVQYLQASIRTSAEVEAGTVHALAISHDGACPAHANNASVSVDAVTDGKIIVNGQVRSAESFDTKCLEVTIEQEEK